MKRLAGAVGLLALLAAAPLIAADPTELPADLQELLPANPAILVTIASVEQLDTQLADLERALADEDEDEEPLDLVAMLAEQLPRFDEIVDTGRPLAMAVDMTQNWVVTPQTATVSTPQSRKVSSRPVLKKADQRGLGSHKSSGVWIISRAISAPSVPLMDQPL